MSTREDTTYDPFKSHIAEAGETYFPFGKPGGGAPIKSDQGGLLPKRRGVDFNRELDSSADINKRKQAADEYLVELRKKPHSSLTPTFPQLVFHSVKMENNSYWRIQLHGADVRDI